MPSHAGELLFHWQDDFTPQEQARLTGWIHETDAALTSLVGPLPFTRHIYFHRASHPREPVPWAHTQRGRKQGVHFYVDTSHSQSDFLNDWTAPHELSHLVLPYLGKQHAWMAEGFASYMQYQVMAQMAVIDADTLDDRYRKRFDRAAQRFELHHLPFSRAAVELRKQRQFPTLYWGGAVFFWQTDQWLQAHAASDIVATLRTFVQCCRRSTRGLTALLDKLDDIAQQPVFTATLSTFRSEAGFPNYVHPPDPGFE